MAGPAPLHKAIAASNDGQDDGILVANPGREAQQQTGRRRQKRASMSLESLESIFRPAAMIPPVHSAMLSACGQTPWAYSMTNPPSANAAAAIHGVDASVAYRREYRNTMAMVARYASVLSATNPRQRSHKNGSASGA